MDALDLSPLLDTAVGIEASRIDAGEPWAVTSIAGLQFYSYDRDDGLEGRVRPAAGDRLSLVRAPENPHDRNAVELWWRNEHQLGHVPRFTAATIAPLMDAGTPLRGYVWNSGDGSSWSADVLLIGPAVASLHGEWLERRAEEAWSQLDWQEVRRRQDRAAASLFSPRDFAREQERRCLDRLHQAVSVFSKLPWEPELPPLGAKALAEQLAAAIGSAPSTVHRIASKAGIQKEIYRRGKFAWAQPYELTSALDEALRNWCREPRAVSRAVVRERTGMAA